MHLFHSQTQNNVFLLNVQFVAPSQFFIVFDLL